MKSLGVIIKVNEPTAWVSSIVVTRKKNSNFRVCLDPGNLNKDILWSYYPFPTLNTVKAKLQKAKIFSTLDPNSMFWTIPLDEEPSKSCTYITPFGRYLFLRLPFGISSAPKIFHGTMIKLFKGIPNISFILTIS